MRKFFFPLVILLSIVSCGRKREVIKSGTESWPQDGLEFITELYIEHDSAFNAWTDKKTGRLAYIQKAASLEELNDSTYSLTKYFISSGKIRAQKQYILKKPAGSWKTFYASGEIESESVYENGLLKSYESRYENGTMKIKGELLPDSTFRHREYFENGVPLKEMVTDKTGKGSCTSYYRSGKIRETGPVADFNPFGIWKIYDTLGNVKQNTLFGIK